MYMHVQVYAQNQTFTQNTLVTTCVVNFNLRYVHVMFRIDKRKERDRQRPAVPLERLFAFNEQKGRVHSMDPFIAYSNVTSLC